MIIWTIKLLGAVRRAIAGRKYPHQLAWAVAFGVLLGVVPHGNLLAIAIVILVLSLKLNHAMAGLVAIGTTFAATHLDPYSHQLGDTVLTHPRVAEVAANAWQLPLVPWTDLNNTIVMGSFLIGVIALLPIFTITYPLFRLFAPAADPEPTKGKETAVRFEEVPGPTHEILVVDQGHTQIAKPHPNPQPAPQPAPKPNDIAKPVGAASPVDALRPAAVTARDAAEPEPQGPIDVSRALNITETVDVDRSAAVKPQRSTAEPVDEPANAAEKHKDVAVETRIDVIRMKDYREAKPTSDSTAPEGEQTEQPMDEALSYLLRQLRDSQQRKVA